MSIEEKLIKLTIKLKSLTDKLSKLDFIINDLLERNLNATDFEENYIATKNEIEVLKGINMALRLNISVPEILLSNYI